MGRRIGPVGVCWMLAFALMAPGALGEDAPSPVDRTPHDGYVKVFEGKPLHGLVGFPGQLELGSPLPVVRPLLGFGFEKGMPWGFWYFYEKGPWTLAVIARPDWERCNYLYNVEVLVVEGEGAPRTAEGVGVGDQESKVVEVYGEDSEVFDEILDSRGTTKTTMFAFGEPPDMTERKAFDRSLKLGRYYPDRGLIFAFEDRKVFRIVSLWQRDPLALWLQPEPDRPMEYIVKADADVDRPTWSHPESEHQKGPLLLPPVPKLTKQTAYGVRLKVPKGWKRKGGRWTAPLEHEFVEVVASRAEEGVSTEAWFDQEKEAFKVDLLWNAQQRGPAAFAKHIGADDVFAMHHQLAGEGIDGFDVRCYLIYASKGDRRFRIEVRRTTNRRDPSPDGIELARQVMRSVRLP